MRVEELRQEIAHIREAIVVYKAYGTHRRPEIAEFEKRKHRLREIVAELESLSRRTSTSK